MSNVPPTSTQTKNYISGIALFFALTSSIAFWFDSIGSQYYRLSFYLASAIILIIMLTLEIQSSRRFSRKSIIIVIFLVFFLGIALSDGLLWKKQKLLVFDVSSTHTFGHNTIDGMPIPDTLENIDLFLGLNRSDPIMTAIQDDIRHYKNSPLVCKQTTPGYYSEISVSDHVKELNLPPENSEPNERSEEHLETDGSTGPQSMGLPDFWFTVKHPLHDEIIIESIDAVVEKFHPIPKQLVCAPGEPMTYTVFHFYLTDLGSAKYPWVFPTAYYIHNDKAIQWHKGSRFVLSGNDSKRIGVFIYANRPGWYLVQIKIRIVGETKPVSVFSKPVWILFEGPNFKETSETISR